MKRIFFCLAIPFLLLINNVSAQNHSQNRNADSVITKKLDRMKKELNLSQEQVNSIKVILSENAKNNEQYKKDIKAIHELKRQNDQNTDTAISKTLTAEQYQKYLKKKAMLKARKGEGRIKEKMAYFREELKLTDQQYNDLKAMMEKTALAKRELKDKCNGNKMQLRDGMKKLMSDNKEQLKQILTKEQLQMLKKLQRPMKP
jgi:hypothetical protein